MTALSTTSLSPAGEAALETLMSCLPADLSRVAKLREVHAACSAAGVVDARSTAETSAGDDDDGAGDVARLHSLFDAAVRHGASSLVCHYVDEVCGRDDFSSPDGVEAYLRDGEMVAEWAVAATRGAEALLASASASAASNVPSAADAADAADNAAAVFEATQDVLGLLGARPDAAGEPEPLEQHRGAGRAGGPDGAGSDAASMRRKLQMSFDDASRGCAHAAALAWLVREGLGGATTPDRHGGPAAWTGAVRARRAAAAAASAGAPEASDGGAGKGVGPRGVPALDDGALFLDDLLQGAGAHPPPYPFKSAAEAAARVFGAGSAKPDALIAKRCLFLYYLLDAGAPADGAPASFARSARLPPRLFAQTVAAAALDDWDSEKRLAEACALVPKMARADLPAKFVAALVARGAPAAALAAARARGSTSRAALDGDEADASSASAASAFAQEADLAVTVRLECGLATEAFLEAAAATDAAAPERRDALAGELAARLASHAAGRDALGTILELPFEGALERALCAWLRENCGRAPGAPAHFAVRYFLLRGRAAEAAAAAASAGTLPAETRRHLDAAIAALPEPLRRLRLDGAAAAALDYGGGTRALALGLETGTATPAEMADTAGGAAAGAAASGGGFVPSFEPGAGTLAVLDGPGPFAGGYPVPGEKPPAVGGKPPFFAPPRFERLSFARERNTIHGRGTRYTSSAAGTASAPARGDTQRAGADASPFGAEDAWTRLRFDGARAGVGLVLSGEDEDMEDAEEHTARADARDADDAEAWAERTPQEPGRGPGPGGPAAASTRRRGAPRRAPLASPFGRKAGASAPTASRLAPPDARARLPGTGTPGSLAARQAGARGRFAPPPAFGASGGIPATKKSAASGEPHAAAPAAKSPRRLSPRASARAAEVVAMDAGGALLAGVSPVVSQRGARSSASRRAPASLFAGTAPASAGAPETRRATRASSRRGGGE